eukprot:COSAG02_NODE_56811_length_283_cov_1.201087_1_plen_33_part_01
MSTLQSEDPHPAIQLHRNWPGGTVLEDMDSVQT